MLNLTNPFVPWKAHVYTDILFIYHSYFIFYQQDIWAAYSVVYIGFSETMRTVVTLESYQNTYKKSKLYM